ncbi:HDOD domain-containing protein [Rhodoferax sp.]|uniref:HDOD domain-containing protein n=1 Tax=Rhodoferax sp. TaxID=50421 RepID=UPI0025DF0709|nr:HDOD domain-containing protein [Rhodoferax sp.]
MELKELLASEAALPSIPKAVALLLSELARPEPDLRKLGQLIGTDPALTTRLLTLANSAMFQLSRKVSSIPEALAILGIDHLRSLAQAAALGLSFRTVPGINLQQFWRYSLNVAKLARALAGTVRQNPATAFTAGLVHAVGELVMHMGLPAEMAALNLQLLPLDLRRARMETRRLGFCYADVGAGFARKWQFPDRIVDALQSQVAPFDDGVYEPLAGVVHLAAWRARAKEVELDENALAVSYPGEVGLALGLDIDMVLQQDPLDWSAKTDLGAFV